MTEKMIPPIYPQLKRTMMIERSPVFGPRVAMKAGRTAPTNPKQNSTATDSLEGVISLILRKTKR